MVRRIYVEKKEPYAVKARELTEEFKNYIGIKAKIKVRKLIRYDVENVGEDAFKQAETSVFSEPPVDILYEGDFEHERKDHIFSVEPLPGQFDQRADSAVQCLEFLGCREKPIISTADVYCISGKLTPSELKKIKQYVMNPVDSRIASEKKPETLQVDYDEPEDIKTIEGFTKLDEASLKKLYDSLSLAMTFRDFEHIRKYFSHTEKRDPFMTEIRVLDTYWSDHCRHTTFLTSLTEVEFEEGFYSEPIRASYEKYLKTRIKLYGKDTDRYISLMDIALMGMKALKKAGKLEDMEKSDEINACSIVVPIEIEEGQGGKKHKKRKEEWLVMFKNETHNHPTPSGIRSAEELTCMAPCGSPEPQTRR